jgi:hypothetical protein
MRATVLSKVLALALLALGSGAFSSIRPIRPIANPPGIENLPAVERPARASDRYEVTRTSTVVLQAKQATQASKSLNVTPSLELNPVASEIPFIFYLSYEQTFFAGTDHRVLRPAAAAQLAGYRTEVFGMANLTSNAEAVLARAFSSAIVVLWRVGNSSKIEELIDGCRKRGIPVGYDLDDLVIDSSIVQSHVRQQSSSYEDG